MKKQKSLNDKASTTETLDDSPSHLLHRVLQIALDIYNAETGEGALTQRQFAVLKALDQAETGANVTQTDLVQATGIDRSTLADMVTRMTTKGLLIRVKSASDGRANFISLSDDGRKALLEMAPKVAAADTAILSLLSPPKRESFVKLLRKISAARSGDVDTSDETEAKSAKTGKKTRAQKADKKADKKKKSGKKADKKPKPATEAQVEPAQTETVDA